MSKPTMGRGLGALMSETKPQGDNQSSTGQPQIAAGVRTLMQGAKSTSATAPTQTATAPAPVTSVSSTPASAARVAPIISDASAGKPKPFVSAKTAAPQISDSKAPAIPRWYFLAADAVLIVVALFVSIKSPTPMPTSRMILAIAIVVLAAGCGMCAVLAGTEKE